MRNLFLLCFFLSISVLFSQETNSPKKDNSKKSTLEGNSGGNSEIFYRGNNVVIEPKNDFVHLSGNAIVNSEGSILRADNIVVDNKNHSVTATGNVSLINRKKDIAYRGDEIHYDTAEKLAHSLQRSTITRKENNINFSADVIELDLNKNTMKGNGNSILFIHHKKPDELKATSTHAFYDFSEDTTRLSKEVLIVETGKNKIEPQSGSIIYCDRATHAVKSKWTTCTGNAEYQNAKERETLSSDLLTHNQITDQLQTKGNSFYRKEQDTRTFTTKSDTMLLKNKEKIIDLQGSVLYTQYPPTNQKAIYEAGCERAHIVETKNESHLIECHDDVRLKNIEEQTTVEGGYLFYNEGEKKGFVTNKPVIKFEKENLTEVFSKRLELDDEQKKVDLIGSVLAKEYMKQQKNIVLSTIECEKGLYLYQGNKNVSPEKGNVFECHEDVVIDRKKDKLVAKGDRLNYYTARKLSELRGNVNFVKSNSNDQHFEGTSGEMDLDNQKKYLLFRKGFHVDSYKEGKKEGSFSGDHGNYSYSEEKARKLRANKDIFVENKTEKYRVWSDHVDYNVDEKIAIFTGSPLLEKEANKKNKNFSYGKVLKVYEKEEEAFLDGPVFAGEVSNSFTLPKTHLWILEKDSRQNYLTCSNAKYIFAQETNLLRCEENVFGTNYEDHQKITSDLVLLDIDKKVYRALGDVEITEDDPKKEIVRHIKSDEADLNSEEKTVTFKDKTAMYNKSRLGTTNQSIKCKKGIYNYLEKGKRTFFCHDDVVITEYVENFTIYGDLLRYYLDQKYSLVDNDPSLYSTNEDSITKITANIFEYFEEEDVVYAKGDVNLENSLYNIKSLFGDYNLEKEEIVLFGNTEINRKDGSKIFANRTVIDTKTQDIYLEENIQGFFPFVDATDENAPVVAAGTASETGGDATNSGNTPLDDVADTDSTTNAKTAAKTDTSAKSNSNNKTNNNTNSRAVPTNNPNTNKPNN